MLLPLLLCVVIALVIVALVAPSILPYPVGWVLGIVSLLSRLVRGVRGRRVVA